MSRGKRHDEPMPSTPEHVSGARQPPADQSPKKPAVAGSAEHDRLEELQQEIQQLKDQNLRLLAEFDNTKKRLSREKEEFIRYAAEAMVRELLPVVDSLDQALVAVDKQADPQAVVKGVHLIYRQLLGLLEKEGVKRIPTVGERFDPHKHEAVAQVETDGKPEDTVAEEVQVGYTMHGKVIRPAIVKVAKKSTGSTQQSSEHDTSGGSTHG